ncbi:hypothetical protein FC99_GL002155 [Levilactobacillus koreensis JCM 16448]|uniref:ABC transporter ATP-binding protein n=1 Tax=Levilactobacillus koreensis TaxID=637971 RepID=A0AAC9ERG4_9LACO|nr:ABC transporter ATP-binding protein [Levilactobacillus koreensis]AKP64816.1 hypothetical protein ABN16_07275 [Levilactobacillus koreensis]KRK85884.1 hypothetical protein FC99_GL002155 [Levilactobacillus koreensis JCM 16448]
MADERGLRSYLFFRWRPLIGLSGLALGNTLSKILLSYAMGWFINLAIARRLDWVLGIGGLAILALGLIYLFSVKLAATQLTIVQGIQQRLKRDLYQALLGRDRQQGQATTTQVAFNMIENTVPTLATDYFGNALSRIGYSLQIILCSAALLWVSVKLFFLFVLISAVPFFVNPLIRRKFGRYKVALNQQVAGHMSLLSGILNGVTTIKAFSATPAFTQQLVQADGQLEQQRRDSTLWDARITQISTLLTMSAQIVCMLVAALFILNGQITIGDLTVTTQLLNYIVPAINGVNTAHLKSVATQPLRAQVQAFLTPMPVTARLPFENGPIAVHHLTYGYTASQPIFTDLSVQFDMHQTTAIIGKSGRGKSTLMKIIAGELAGYQGTVTIGGVDIAAIVPADLYRHVVYVNQSPVIFKGTVEQNVTLFGTIRSSAVTDILRQLGLLEMRQRFVTAGDAQLSGGERQRISLARALLVAAPILIIDEPDSGQDPETAAIIQRLIFSLQNQTVLVVTHNWDAAYLGRFDRVVKL